MSRMRVAKGRACLDDGDRSATLATLNLVTASRCIIEHGGADDVEYNRYYAKDDEGINMSFQAPKRVKRSVDLNEETDFLIDHYRHLLKKQGVTASRGTAIDNGLAPLYSLSPEQAAKLKQFIDRECASSEQLLKATPSSDMFSKAERRREASALRGLSNVLETLADGIIPEQPMRKIPIQGNKALLIPDDPENWIVANEEDALCSDKATIVEVRNGKIYGMPHFVVFHSGDVSTETIDEIVIRAFPKFEETLNRRIDPLYDAKGNLLNLAEWSSSPAIGRFPAMPHNAVLGNPYRVEIINEGGKEATI